MRVAWPRQGQGHRNDVGPLAVTADELEPYRNDDGFLDLERPQLSMGRRLADRLSHMGWTFEEMVAYASRGTWVRPGDVLGSGTCGNGGCLAELWGRTGARTHHHFSPATSSP